MIVMLTCQFTEILGGAEKQCATLTKALHARGEDVVVVTSKIPNVSVANDATYVKRFWTYCPPNWAGRHLLSSLLWGVQVFAWIVWNRRRISVLHCHQLRIHAYVAALAQYLLGIPTVMKLGVGGEQNDFVVIGRRKYIFGPSGARFVVRHTNALMATASQIEKDALTWGVPQGRIHRVPNGVDMTAVAPIQIGGNDPRLVSFDRTVHLAFIGRLSTEKNILQIVDAFISLAPLRPVVLNLIGDGPLRGAILDRINKLHPNIKIRLHGEVSDVFALLKDMHFLVLVSAAEGLSNALLESCCAGLVPLLSDASGNRDVVTYADYPYFVKDQAVASIAATMAQACALTKEEWGAWSVRIAKDTRQAYDINVVAEKYSRIYREISVQPKT